MTISLESTALERAPAAAGSAYEELWWGFPLSTVHKQKQLAGCAHPAAAGAAAGAVERSGRLLDGGLYEALRVFAAARALSFDAVMLGAYHLLLQSSLEDVESLIGCCLVTPAPDAGTQGGNPSATMRPSYLYAEDDEPLDDVLSDLERQLRAGPSVAVHLDRGADWETGRAPVFFYLGIDGARAHDDRQAGLPGLAGAQEAAAATLERRVVVSAAAGGGQALVGWTMQAETARLLGREDFPGRYEQALSLLAGAGLSRAGEIRERLGDSPAATDAQLAAMQQRVIALWARVLGIAEAGLQEDSSYFEVGGTSLNAFKLVNRVRVEFQRDLSLQDLIENPSIRQFARILLRS